MNKKRVIKYLIGLLNLIVVFILIWSIINYKVLNQEVTDLAKTGGLVVMVFLVIFLEGAPSLIGSSVVVAAILAMNSFNPWLILLLFIVSAIIGNIIYFCLGHFFGKRIMGYFDEGYMKKYKDLFKKYGGAAMMITAISPTPYFPELAGAFRVTSKSLLFKILILRIIRHTVVFFFWFFIFVGF